MAETASNDAGKEYAIYVLPGYMGSQLFENESEANVWVNSEVLLNDAMGSLVPGATSVLGRDAQGGSAKVKPIMEKDPYGTLNTYQPLIAALNQRFGEAYDIVFFPYDWLGNLSDEAARLEAHVKDHGYKNIILITHSTGGLLASNYIARSYQNKRTVAKAILVAPPLYGTLTSLQPLETGKSTTSDQFLTESGLSGFKLSAAHNWIKGVTKNSPTTYQLLPSQEYLGAKSIIDNTGDSGMAITGLDGYYGVLNRSLNINANLTNGLDEVSHRSFRSSGLNDDIVQVLKGVDTIVVGSSSGTATPSIAKYGKGPLGNSTLDDIIFQSDGDGTVLGMSASAANSNHQYGLTYVDFPGVSHTSLLQDPRSLAVIAGQIPRIVSTTVTVGGGSGDIAPASEDDLDLEEQAEGTGVQMDDMVKLIVQSDEEVALQVVDPENNVISVDQCTDSRVIYQTLHEDMVTKDYRKELYVPKQGWKVLVYSAPKMLIYQQLAELGITPETMGVTMPDAENDVKVSVALSTLDGEGFRTATATYGATRTVSATDPVLLAGFDLSEEVTPENVGMRTLGMDVDVVTATTDWGVESSVVLDGVSATKTLGLEGTAVEEGAISFENLALTTSDEGVVTVSPDGTLTATGLGRATVAAYSSTSDKVSICNVLVQRLAQEVHVDDVEIGVGERMVPPATFDSDDVTNTELTLASSDESIVAVRGDVLIGMSAGEATITATVDGNASTTFKATVAGGAGPHPFFLDVDPGDEKTHGPDVNWMGVAGISTGWAAEGGRVFRGMWNVKRCDFAAFMYRMADLADDGERNDSLALPAEQVAAVLAGVTDCDETTPHANEVAWLIGTGISRGWTNQDGQTISFKPHASIVRQDMAAFLYRFADLADDGALNNSPQAGPYQTIFTDVTHGDTKNHADEVEWLASVGVTRGWAVSDNTYEFRGMKNIVRQDMAAFMHRLALGMGM